MKLRTQRRIALGALIAVAILAIAYGVYWCMEPVKGKAVPDIPSIVSALNAQGPGARGAFISAQIVLLYSDQSTSTVLHPSLGRLLMGGRRAELAGVHSLIS